MNTQLSLVKRVLPLLNNIWKKRWEKVDALQIKKWCFMLVYVMYHKRQCSEQKLQSKGSYRKALRGLNGRDYFYTVFISFRERALYINIQENNSKHTIHVNGFNLYYIIVCNLTNHILKFQEDLMIGLLTIHPFNGYSLALQGKQLQP